MKILLLQDHLRSGGTERQTVFLTQAFRTQGHAAAIQPFREGGALQAEASPICLPPLHRRPWDWYAPGLSRAVAAYAPEVVLPMGRMANCYAGWLQRQLPAVTVLSTVRTGKPLPWLYRSSLHATRACVVNSAETAQRLTSTYGLAPDKIHVIHNSLVHAPAVPLSVAERAEARRVQGVPPEAVVLLCVGMFRPEKGQAELIRLVQGLPADLPWQLWLAGDGEELPRCREWVQAFGLTERIRFLGLQADPRPWYALADIAVLTSQRESLSNFLIEAQAHGLPAVAYAVQGVKECLVDGESGFAVLPGDAESFRARLLALASDGETRRSAGERARHFAAQAFSPTGQVQRYLDLFSTLRSRPA